MNGIASNGKGSSRRQNKSLLGVGRLNGGCSPRLGLEEWNRNPKAA